MHIVYFCDVESFEPIRMRPEILVYQESAPEIQAAIMGTENYGSPSESVWLVPGTFDEDGRCILEE